MSLMAPLLGAGIDAGAVSVAQPAASSSAATAIKMGALMVVALSLAGGPFFPSARLTGGGSGADDGIVSIDM
ncbi:hypothetical protein D9M69_595950 [compost metagenome]